MAGWTCAARAAMPEPKALFQGDRVRAKIAGMESTPPFDLQIAHQYFAVQCFNQAWRLIEKVDRSPADDEQMIELAHASMWHWLEREDCAARNRSIGYWHSHAFTPCLGRLTTRDDTETFV